MQELERLSMPKRSLQIDPEVLLQLTAPPPGKTEMEKTSLVCAQEAQPANREQMGRTAVQTAAAALRSGNYETARQLYAQGINLLDGQIPATELMQLLRCHAQACLQSDSPIDNRLVQSTPEQVRAALPSLQRLVDIGNDSAEALDRQNRNIRPGNLMDLAYAQMRLNQFEDGASNYLSAIQLLEGNPNRNQTLLYTALNNYIFALQQLPATAERTAEIARRREQFTRMQGR